MNDFKFGLVSPAGWVCFGTALGHPKDTTNLPGLYSTRWSKL